MPWGSEYPPMSEERKAEIDQHLNETYDRELRQWETEVLEQCACVNEGKTDPVSCNCEEIVRDMRKLRVKWRKKTLEKGPAPSR
jgi:hypothetical protein